MAGYIGSKAAVTQVDGYTKSEADGRYVEGDDTLYVDQTNNLVGIGTSSPVAKLQIKTQTNGNAAFQNSTSVTGGVKINAFNDAATASVPFEVDGSSLQFNIASVEKVRIDSSGNLLVGKTASSFNAAGLELEGQGRARFTRDGAVSLQLNRLTSDGDLALFYKDGSAVGGIGIQANGFYIDGESGHTGLRFSASAFIPRDNQADVDNVVDLGASSHRFDDVHATNGTIQTSDRNEKQDIAELSDAEQRVAVAAKGLLRKFRWKSAVAEKGEAARTHFGIIAQDLQSAFAAEGLDAGDYAMFISTTWWETQTEVPAVEADEENGIEAADAYTRTDTYDTAEEAPEGAAQKTRLGVRYSELLAFIIGAL